MYGRKGIASPRYGSGQKLYVYSSDKLEPWSWDSPGPRLISIYRTIREAQAAMQSDRRTLKAFAQSHKVFRSMFILSFEPLDTRNE